MLEEDTVPPQSQKSGCGESRVRVMGLGAVILDNLTFKPWQTIEQLRDNPQVLPLFPVSRAPLLEYYQDRKRVSEYTAYSMTMNIWDGNLDHLRYSIYVAELE